MRFVKMHGNGNDFVMFDEFYKILVPEKEKPAFVRAICHRNFGVGGDGAIFVQKSNIANAKFRYFNSDGSEAAMCGNGIRCFARYVVEEGYAKEGRVKVETLAGIIDIDVWKDRRWWIRVNMGKVDYLWCREMEINGKRYVVHATKAGVPHAVIFVEDLDFEIVPDARIIRYHSLFPEGTNVNFVKVDGKKLYIRTYERGVEAETLSCGSGSVASAFVARKLSLVDEVVEVQTKGGILIVELKDTAYMIGSANRVFEGEIREDELHKI
ncbi:MAG: diaminopimelate epimerase [Archaeoglobales archaeon]|nr:diaminopimelate epimerase [Archaeoglobales archaeon]